MQKELVGTSQYPCMQGEGMPRKSKIEDLKPNHPTALGCFRLALDNLDNPALTDKQKILRARHNIRDGLMRLGFKERDVEVS